MNSAWITVAASNVKSTEDKTNGFKDKLHPLNHPKIPKDCKGCIGLGVSEPICVMLMSEWSNERLCDVFSDNEAFEALYCHFRH